MGLNYYASSPTLILPPQQPSHHLMHRCIDEVAKTDSRDATSSSSPRYVSKIPTPPSMNYLANSRPSLAGRKRSRADVGEDVEEAVATLPDTSVRPITGHEQAPEDSTLALRAHNPAVSMHHAQYDIRVGEQAVSSLGLDKAERPTLTARKSQRRIDERLVDAANFFSEIDPIIRVLGIGWKRTKDSSCPSIAGHQSFIRNQFSFQEPQILLQHEGLGIFVVRTKSISAHGYWQQWWLFTEDLKSCRFLCNDESDLLRRLDNKKQDERGIWQPEILVEGPVIRAKDAISAMAETTRSLNTMGDSSTQLVSTLPTSVQGDVDMQM